jgi:hypothetical protein
VDQLNKELQLGQITIAEVYLVVPVQQILSLSKTVRHLFNVPEVIRLVYLSHLLKLFSIQEAVTNFIYPEHHH